MSLLLRYTESVALPDFSGLYTRIGIEEIPVNSIRKAMAALKQKAPSFILAEFIYAWSNNYASCHISNLDSLLASIPKYASGARVIVLAQRAELEYAGKLGEVYPLHGILPLPVSESELEAMLIK